MTSAIMDIEETGLLAGPPTNITLPAALAEARERGWERFQELPRPVRTDQSWRFTDLSKVLVEPFRVASQLDKSECESILAASVAPISSAGRMVFGNDSLIGTPEISPDLASSEVLWLPLDKAAEQREEIFRRHFMARETGLGAAKFAALHQAFVRAGTFLYVPDGTEIALPLFAFHWLHGADSAVFPHTLLVAGANSKVTFVDQFRSANSAERGFAVAVTDIVAGAGAQVNYVCLQDWSQSSVSFQLNTTHLDRDASVKVLHVNLGSHYARVESRSFLNGQGARSDMLEIGVASGEQEYDLRTFQDHLAPGATSDLLYKNALDDQSRSTFAGLIRVEKGAHQTDAYQTNRNLLLSGDAEANSLPGLEILADNVKCSHGATTGQLSDDELFYLRARGIPVRTAQQLLTLGFLGEVLDRLDEHDLAAAIRTRIEERFAHNNE